MDLGIESVQCHIKILNSRRMKLFFAAEDTCPLVDNDTFHKIQHIAPYGRMICVPCGVITVT